MTTKTEIYIDLKPGGGSRITRKVYVDGVLDVIYLGPIVQSPVSQEWEDVLWKAEKSALGEPREPGKLIVDRRLFMVSGGVEIPLG